MSDQTVPAGLTISYRPISALRPNKKNPRTHTKAQIAKVAASMEEFGWTVPILIDAEDRIIAGHGRLEAATLLKLDEVPTIRIEHLGEEQLRAYALADNRLAELAGWDDELLAIELGELCELDLDFDVTITGFETAEIDILIQDLQESEDPADDIPVVEPDRPAVSVLGDHWQLGSSSIFCGDATDEESYRRLMRDERAAIVFTDPPFNVPMKGHATGLGQTTHPEFLMASGEMTLEQFIRFLMSMFELLVRWSIDGSIHFVCMDWRHQLEILTAGALSYEELKNVCVWSKTNAGMGSLYRSQYELVYVYKNGTAPHTNNVELGRHGRYRTNVWTYAGVNTFREGRDDELAMHPTVKPVEMVADALLDCSNRGSIVLDCCGGSGTTLIAAEKTGRRARLIELDPLYVDVSVRRYESLTGEEAVHADSGLTFSEVAARRTADKEAADLPVGQEPRDE